MKPWKQGDPPHRRRANGKVMRFSRLAQRGTQIAVNEKVVKRFGPSNGKQTQIGLDLYYTEKDDAEYCDEFGVKMLDSWCVNIPVTNERRSISFILTFGTVEIEAIAQNTNTGEIFDEATFYLDI